MTVTTQDSLLQCLLALSRYHGNATTAKALCGVLPLDGRQLTPGLFERAASRVGLVSRVIHRRAEEIELALLPAVIIPAGLTRMPVDGLG